MDDSSTDKGVSRRRNEDHNRCGRAVNKLDSKDNSRDLDNF